MNLNTRFVGICLSHDMKLFCTFVVFCCNVPLLGSLSLLSADALLGFLSVLLGSVDSFGCHGAVSLITLLRCFAGFCCFIGFSQRFVGHGPVPFYPFSSCTILSIASLGPVPFNSPGPALRLDQFHFPGFCFHPRKLPKAS